MIYFLPQKYCILNNQPKNWCFLYLANFHFLGFTFKMSKNITCRNYVLYHLLYFFFNHKKIDAYININYVYLHTFYIFYADFMKGYKIRRVYPDGLSFLKKTNHGNFSLWFCVAHFKDRTIKSTQYWEIFNRFHNTLLIAGKIYNTPTLFTFFYFNVFFKECDISLI